MAAERLVGMLLGAGASYDLGMPLVAHLTGEFKGYFTPTHLRELNDRWLVQRGGFDDDVIEITIQLLEREDYTYEKILGTLQEYGQAHHPKPQQYQSLYVKMLEMVTIMLLWRQVRNFKYFYRGLPPFEGFTEFARQSSPLWAFSLNHDLLFEMISGHCNVPLRDGFWPQKNLIIPRIDEKGVRHGSLVGTFFLELV